MSENVRLRIAVNFTSCCANTFDARRCRVAVEVQEGRERLLPLREFRQFPAALERLVHLAVQVHQALSGLSEPFFLGHRGVLKVIHHVLQGPGGSEGGGLELDCVADGAAGNELDVGSQSGTDQQVECGKVSNHPFRGLSFGTLGEPV